MNFLVEARRLAQKKFNDARAVIAAQEEWPVASGVRFTESRPRICKRRGIFPVIL